MIGDLAQHLLTQLGTVSEFGTRIGLAMGAKKIDPLMVTIPVPATWVIFRGDDPLTENVQNRGPAPVRSNFIIRVLVDYAGDSDLILAQYPLLESVITAINGTTPTAVPGCSGWKFEGSTIDEINDNRLGYDLLFSTTFVYPCT